MRLIDANALYERLDELEELARDRVIDTLNSFSNGVSKFREEILNCPNCGAPISGDRCDYCGTQFIDRMTIQQDKRFYVLPRIENGFIKDKNRRGIKL